MKKILNQYCKGRYDSGLLLLSMPTGFGKTYNILDFIFKSYQEFADQERKIIFVTNLKKNLPIDELKQRFDDQDKENSFHQHVLFLDSNADTVIQNILSLDAEIPELFKDKTYHKLKSSIYAVNRNNIANEITDPLRKEIRLKLEPSFRKAITEHLFNRFPSKNARLSAIKNNSQYQWIGELYPTVFTDERTVLFLSMDKFLVKNTTLIEQPYYIHERLLDNALIFIDEFDATKERVLNSIIKSGLQHKVDLLDLFLNIHSSLKQNEHPEVLLNESKWSKEKRNDSKKQWQKPEEIVTSFQEKAEAIFNRFNLQYTCKLDGDFFGRNRNFLFYDYQFHHVLDAHNKGVEITPSPATRTNWIKEKQNTADSNSHDIRSLLNTVNGFLTYFQRGIGFLANNYRYLKNENKELKESFSLEYSIRTVLNHFRLNNSAVNFLTKNIIEGDNFQSDSQNIRKGQLQSFYDVGFRYHDIVDSDEHDTLSKIYMFNFNRTPESFLANVCSKAMVIGVSATASLYTNVGNYDLNYLKNRLGNSFMKLSDESLKVLKSSYDDSTKGYKNITINTSFIEASEYEQAIDKLIFILDDNEAVSRLINIISAVSEDKNILEYTFCRYVRVLCAWKYFIDNPDCHSFLCLFNKFPKSQDMTFDLDILLEYSSLLLEDRELDIKDATSTLVVLRGGSSRDFQKNKTKITTDLKKGKRRFIISTYQTVGAGQNLQYPVPSSLKPIHINEFPKREEMDISGIYLDRPTNLLVNIQNNNIEDDSFIKYIFQLEFLVENGAISPRDFKYKLKEAFQKYVGKYKSNREQYNNKSLYRTEAYTLFLNKIIIQALGRICRTNMKSHTIHILADDSIKYHLANFSLPDDVIPIHEFSKLVEKAKITGSKKENQTLDGIQNRASLRSKRTISYILGQLNSPWTEESIKNGKR